MVAVPPLRPALRDTHPVHDMTGAADEELAERARKLFAGPIEFLKSAPGAQVPARPDRAGDRVRGAVERRQELAPQRADQPQQAGADVEHARADAGAQLLRRRRAAANPPGRHAGLWLCRSAQGHGQALALPDQRLSARPAGAQARAGADRFAPRHQGRRPRRDGDARRRGGQLSSRADQGRQGQAVGARRDSTKTTATEAAKHPAAHPAIFTTSSETGSGIAELRTAIFEAAA